MPIATRSGPAVILASSTITAFMAHPLVINLDLPFPLQIEFHFRTDADVEDVAVHIETGDDRFKLICVNFDKPDGRGTSVPVLLGALESLLLFMHFRVFRYGNTEDRTVHYTLYGVDKDVVDWTPLTETEEDA